MSESSDLQALADLLDACEPGDDAPVTWGALRRQVREAADRSLDPCTCGYGGLHEPANARCLRNQP